MVKLNAKANGLTIVIRAKSTALEPGMIVAGVYIHRPRERTFEFISEGRTMVFDRSDWEVI